MGLATIMSTQSVTLATANTLTGPDSAAAPVPAPTDGDTATARRYCAATTKHMTHDDDSNNDNNLATDNTGIVTVNGTTPQHGHG